MPTNQPSKHRKKKPSYAVLEKRLRELQADKSNHADIQSGLSGDEESSKHGFSARLCIYNHEILASNDYDKASTYKRKSRKYSKSTAL